MIERRTGKRFVVDWAARVGTVATSANVVLPATVCNISSTGALLKVSRLLRAGERIEVFIKLPMRKDNWMKYTARVTREATEGGVALAAVMFDEPSPQFRASAPDASAYGDNLSINHPSPTRL